MLCAWTKSSIAIRKPRLRWWPLDDAAHTSLTGLWATSTWDHTTASECSRAVASLSRPPPPLPRPSGASPESIAAGQIRKRARSIIAGCRMVCADTIRTLPTSTTPKWCGLNCLAAETLYTHVLVSENIKDPKDRRRGGEICRHDGAQAYRRRSE